MAWRIDQFVIKNFKFFGNTEFVLPVNGRNVLLYGENGAGKSSIYWSFYTFFQACLKRKEDDVKKYFTHGHSQNLRHWLCSPDDSSYLKLSFINNGVGINFKISDSGVSIADEMFPNFMRLSMAASDFMNYKFLASIFDFRNSQENDIFDVLSREVFPFLNFRQNLFLDDGTDSGRNDADIWWKYLSDPDAHVPRRNNSADGPYIISSPEYRAYMQKLDRFNLLFEQSLRLIFNEANKKIESLFKEKISLDINYHKATFNNLKKNSSKAHDGLLVRPRVILTAKMNDAIIDSPVIEHPRSFFNEARLTCMALALRLAFLDARTVAGSDFAQVLFIDDLLISLDMGCRYQVIDILLNYSKHKQLFIFTHDRAFFNITKSLIKSKGGSSNWVMYNLYADKLGDISVPKLLQDSSLIDSAKYKFSIYDLPGCANSLRSAYEQELKRILPFNHICSLAIDKHVSLNDLVGKFSTFRTLLFDSSLNQFPDLLQRFIAVR